MLRARVIGHGNERCDDEQEDEREHRKERRKSDLVRGLLPLRALDEVDHAVHERVARLRGYAHLDLVRKDARAARDRRTVAAAFADHGSRFARNRRLIDRRGTLDDVAIARDRLARTHHDDVTGAKTRGANLLDASILAAHAAHGRCLRGTERIGLRLTSTLSHSLGEVREHDREEQPDREREHEHARLEKAHDDRDERAHLDDKHDGRAHHVRGVQLAQRLWERLGKSARREA